MTRASRPPRADEQAKPGGVWGRGDAALLVLGSTTLALIAVQFTLAGFGAFAMDKTPTDNAYGAHKALGLVIALMTLLILAAALASRSARTHRRSLWLTVTLAALSVVLQPVLGSGGTTVPALGALHALNGLLIFILVGWLTWETAHRRAAIRKPAGTAPSATRTRADP